MRRSRDSGYRAEDASMRQRIRVRGVPTAVVAVLMVAGLAACSHNKPAVCDDLASVKSTTQDLKARHLAPGSLTDVRADLDKLKGELSKLASDASSQYDSEVNALKSRLDDLQTAASAVAAHPSVTSLQQLHDAVDAVGTSVDNLSHAVSTTC